MQVNALAGSREEWRGPSKEWVPAIAETDDRLGKRDERPALASQLVLHDSPRPFTPFPKLHDHL